MKTAPNPTRPVLLADSANLKKTRHDYAAYGMGQKLPGEPAFRYLPRLRSLPQAWCLPDFGRPCL